MVSSYDGEDSMKIHKSTSKSSDKLLDKQR